MSQLHAKATFAANRQKSLDFTDGHRNHFANDLRGVELLGFLLIEQETVQREELLLGAIGPL
jgi:hypothetical protein